MTDEVPETRAGRALLDGRWIDNDYARSILAIEAEARETEKQRAAREGVNGFQLGLIRGRADALREAANRVRTLEADSDHIIYDGDVVVSYPAVLAILTDEP